MRRKCSGNIPVVAQPGEAEGQKWVSLAGCIFLKSHRFFPVEMRCLLTASEAKKPELSLSTLKLPPLNLVRSPVLFIGGRVHRLMLSPPSSSGTTSLRARFLPRRVGQSPRASWTKVSQPHPSFHWGLLKSCLFPAGRRRYMAGATHTPPFHYYHRCTDE